MPLFDVTVSFHKIIFPGRMHGDEKADVRVVLIGDSGVGKTSLLISLLEDEWVDRVPKKQERLASSWLHSYFL